MPWYIFKRNLLCRTKKQRDPLVTLSDNKGPT